MSQICKMLKKVIKEKICFFFIFGCSTGKTEEMYPRDIICLCFFFFHCLFSCLRILRCAIYKTILVRTVRTNNFRVRLRSE